jgi:hypothetical protein
MPLEPARRRLSVILLFLWLIQSVAALGVPCTLSQDHGTGTDMAGMEHAGHHMDMPDSPDTVSNGCCEGGGLCSMSHCFSVAALPQPLVTDGFSPAPPWLPDAAVLPPVHTPESLYRPPIPA